MAKLQLLSQGISKQQAAGLDDNLTTASLPIA
jgi:hypothetical protein